MKVQILITLLLILTSVALRGQEITKEKRHSFEVEIEHQRGIEAYSIEGVSLSNRYRSYALYFVNKWKIGSDRRASLGVLAGLRGYHNPVANTVPIQLEYSRILSRENTSWEGYARAGYCFQFWENTAAGWFTSLGAEWNPKIGRKDRFGFGFGFTMQNLQDRELILIGSNTTETFEDDIYAFFFQMKVAYRIF